MKKEKNKKKSYRIICLVLVFCIIVVIALGIRIFFNLKRFYSPKYNSNYITEINIANKEIKDKYQFIFLSDLHASILDKIEKQKIWQKNIKI